MYLDTSTSRSCVIAYGMEESSKLRKKKKAFLDESSKSKNRMHAFASIMGKSALFVFDQGSKRREKMNLPRTNKQNSVKRIHYRLSMSFASVYSIKLTS